MRIIQLVILSFNLILAGCTALKQPEVGSDREFLPSYPHEQEVQQISYDNGAIYNSNTALPLFETARARHVGDILTVILVEKTDAQKKATTRSRKNDQIQATTPEFLGKPLALAGNYNLDFDINVKRQFDSDGQSMQNNSLAGNITVTIGKVFGNGNMLIQGEKWIQINQGKEFVRLSGIIRSQDIKPDNTIMSTRIANAKIYYGGTGQINNTNTQGWLAKFLWGSFVPV